MLCKSGSCHSNADTVRWCTQLSLQFVCLEEAKDGGILMSSFVTGNLRTLKFKRTHEGRIWHHTHERRCSPRPAAPETTLAVGAHHRWNFWYCPDSAGLEGVHLPA